MIPKLMIKRAKIFFLFFSWFLLTCTVGFAKPVTINVAKQVAENWMLQQTGVEHKAFRDSIPLFTDEQQDGIIAYYVFNMDPGGWVIVAGDDVAYPIVGYAAQGTANADDVPPAFREWMAQIEEQIRSAAREELSPLAGIEAAWEKLNVADYEVYEVSLGAVTPLVKTTWSQGKYYNTKCPVDSAGPDGRALVGCCATAIGQVMKYHNWPSNGIGSHSYSHPKYGTLSANFGATNYNWSSMPSTGQVTSYNNAVATLLYHVGVSVDMDYGPTFSGCSPNKIATGLDTYFRYKPVSFVWRASYSDSTWMTKIKTDLNAKRPIVYTGYGTGGHAFVCDGYQGTAYFHFNWGWNGSYDGYFYLNDLTPGSDNFTINQGAIFGIEPPESTIPPFLPGIPLLLNGGCPAIPNGDFESGAVSWTQNSSSGTTLIGNWVMASHSGTWHAWQGYYHNETSYVQQQVKVSCPQLVFYHQIVSDEIGCNWDIGQVKINNAVEKTIGLCQTNNTNGWVKTSVDLSAYADQTVTLQFYLITDGSIQSSWHIDTVQFN